MAVATCSDSEFIALLEQHGAAETARQLGLTSRPIYERRRKLEHKLKRAIKLPTPKSGTLKRVYKEYPHRHQIEVENGIVLIGSDLHCWPGSPPTAWRAFLKFASDLKPRAVILNGDVIDGAMISRHPPINWESRPALIEEIKTAQQMLAELEKAAPKAQLAWTMGNHDARLESRLAAAVPEFAKVNGVHLKDHFSDRWKPCWSCWINQSVAVKHRYSGGLHATHNNAVKAGVSIVTGHDHALRVSPWTDYTGTRWGVSTGCLAEPDGPQFDYSEDNPKNHRSGFAILTFVDGELLQPELVRVHSFGVVDFRGSLIKV